jgi:hypothetical protein
MADELAQLNARVADVTQQLRIERGKLANLERFSVNTGLRAVAVVSSSPPGRALSAGSKLPSSMATNLIAARDALAEARRVTEQLEKQKNDAAAMLTKTQDGVNKTIAETAQAVSETKFGTEDSRHYRDPLARLSTVEELRRQIGELFDQQQHYQRENERVSSLLHEASTKTLEKDDMDWQLFSMRAEVGIKEAQLASVDDEIRSIERIFARKEVLLDRRLAASNETEVLALEAAKEVAQMRLTKHQEASRLTAASTRHRALGIMQREEKLQFFGDAIRQVLNVEEDGEETHEVSADEVDSVRLKIAAARRREAELCAALDFLDAQVSNLEARVDILVHATMTLEHEQETEERSFAKRSATLDRDVKTQRQTAEGMVSAQRAQQATKEIRISQIRQRQQQQRRSVSQPEPAAEQSPPPSAKEQAVQA